MHFTDEVEKHLEECASDNLIAVTRKVGQKGSKVGIEQEGFRLPTPPVSTFYNVKISALQTSKVIFISSLS